MRSFAILLVAVLGILPQAVSAGDLDRAERRQDARDARDDRRDLRKDVRDARLEAAVAARRDAIGAELQRLRGRTAPPELDAKRGLIVELVRLARGEVIGDRESCARTDASCVKTGARRARIASAEGSLADPSAAVAPGRTPGSHVDGVA